MIVDFETPRLIVAELSADSSVSDRAELLEEIPRIFTPAVVAHLPPHFSGIRSAEEAEEWLVQMFSESHLFLARARDDRAPVGFLFVHETQERDAHIGFLLREVHWGQGLASELLRGFIDEASKDLSFRKLVGGVSLENFQSQKLFEKLGFIKRLDDRADVLVYEIPLPHDFS